MISNLEKRKHNTLTLADKWNILQQLDSGAKQYDLAREYNVGRATIYDIKRNRSKIETFVKTTGCGNRQTMRSGDYPIVEAALYSWFLQETKKKKVFPRQCLRDKAKYFFKEIMKEGEFLASDSWIDRFKKRYGIRSLSGGNKYMLQSNDEVLSDKSFFQPLSRAACGVLKTKEINDLEEVKSENACANLDLPLVMESGCGGNIDNDYETEVKGSYLQLMEVDVNKPERDPVDDDGITTIETEDPLDIENETPNKMNILHKPPMKKYHKVNFKSSSSNIIANLETIHTSGKEKHLIIQSERDEYEGRCFGDGERKEDFENYFDEDKSFLMSLLPAMKKLTNVQKKEFKKIILNELNRLRFPSTITADANINVSNLERTKVTSSANITTHCQIPVDNSSFILNQVEPKITMLLEGNSVDRQICNDANNCIKININPRSVQSIICLSSPKQFELPNHVTSCNSNSSAIQEFHIVTPEKVTPLDKTKSGQILTGTSFQSQIELIQKEKLYLEDQNFNKESEIRYSKSRKGIKKDFSKIKPHFNDCDEEKNLKSRNISSEGSNSCSDCENETELNNSVPKDISENMCYNDSLHSEITVDQVKLEPIEEINFEPRIKFELVDTEVCNYPITK